MKAFCIAILLLVVLTGCASTPENLHKFEGKHYKELIMAYGKPKDIYMLESGNRVYIYEEDVSWLTNTYAKYMKKIKTFEVDRNGMVISSRSNVVRYQGPSVLGRKQAGADN